MAESFLETTYLPACRDLLVRHARWAYLGRLAHLSERCLACTIRRLAPSLTGTSDHDVLVTFGHLICEVMILDMVTNDAVFWCAFMDTDDPDMALAAAQLQLDCTLAALIPGESL